MLLDLEKAKKAELIEELGLYVKAGIEVAKFGITASNAARVAEIKRLQGTVGIPVEITEKFAEENPELAAFYKAQGEEFKVGEIIFAEEVDFEAAKKLAAEAGVDLPPTPPAPTDLGPEPKEPEEPAASVGGIFGTVPPVPTEMGLMGASMVVAAAVPAELVYNRKTVSRVGDVIVSGRSYKDVTVASGETFRLTQEEFARDVQPRQ